MAKKTRFTVEQHEKMGKELQIIRDRLGQICVEIDNSYPRSSGMEDLAFKSQKFIDELRNKLDSCIFDENRSIATIAFAKVYYRSGVDGERPPAFAESLLTIVESSQSK